MDLLIPVSQFTVVQRPQSEDIFIRKSLIPIAKIQGCTEFGGSNDKLLSYVRGVVEVRARSDPGQAAAYARSFLTSKPELDGAIRRAMQQPEAASTISKSDPDLDNRLRQIQIGHAATEWRSLLADGDDINLRRTGPPLAARDVLPPPASRLLTAIEPDARLSLGGMVTREVWPTRVSKLHLPTALPAEMSDGFVQRLNDAAYKIYSRFRDRKYNEYRHAGQPQPSSDVINNGFFQEQQSEECVHAL